MAQNAPPKLAGSGVKGARLVHIGQCGNEADCDVPQARQRVAERVLARPAHVRKGLQHARAALHAHEPVPPVQGSAEHGLVTAEASKRRRDMRRCDTGNPSLPRE